MERKSKNLLKISEIAEIAGVMPSTVRYYTDIGLLNFAGETPGGHRLYERDYAIARINRIQFLNKKGVKMIDIKKELSDMGGKNKILVIDDETDIVDLIRDMVNNQLQTCEIKVVYDGFSAGRILSDYLPDLIILDIMLPGVNGFDVCKQIRNSNYLNTTKILAITGYDSEENRKKIMGCGANDYMPKPMDIPVLKDKITKLLNLK